MNAGAFEIFGNKGEFALEVRLVADDRREAAPLDSVGSWGDWRLWISDINLCEIDYRTPDGITSASEIRWYLAPLFRWFAQVWTPLLHEGRLPSGGRWGDSRPRWARLAYLSMLAGAGDDLNRFGPWQDWASRHALRSAAQGGIVPDIFFHRQGDEIELSWGDRVQPGAEAASFNFEDGVARVSVDAFATVIRHAVDWFCNAVQGDGHPWVADLASIWTEARSDGSRLSALNWFLDGRANPGPLSRLLMEGLHGLGRPMPAPPVDWWGTLSPEVAMFGALAPQISQKAASAILSAYFDASTDEVEPDRLVELRHDDPAWMAVSPWASGYSLAEDLLEQADPAPSAERTELEQLVSSLGIVVVDAHLDAVGPRGVAIAGENIRPTILVNVDHPAYTGVGRRFTIGHELCHILHDRERARPLAHTSTPWAPAAVEQRANAFAAMLLMPKSRARRPLTDDTVRALRSAVRSLARTLGVSETALKQHLANLGEISPEEGGILLGEGGVRT